MDAWDAFIIRQSVTCKACGGGKRPGRSVCGLCWKQLTPELRKGLRARIETQTHADALKSAIAHIQNGANV